MHTSSRPRRDALKRGTDADYSIVDFRLQIADLLAIAICNPNLQSKSSICNLQSAISPIVRRDERDWPLLGKGGLEDIGSRVAVHVAADRQPEEVQHRRHDVDHRRPWQQAASRDRGA